MTIFPKSINPFFFLYFPHKKQHLFLQLLISFHKILIFLNHRSKLMIFHLQLINPLLQPFLIRFILLYLTSIFLTLIIPNNSNSINIIVFLMMLFNILKISLNTTCLIKLCRCIMFEFDCWDRYLVIYYWLFRVHYFWCCFVHK